MTEYSGKCERVECELMEIAAALTAMGDMIQGLFLNEEMEPGTSQGVKILIMGIRKRIDDLKKYLGSKGN